MLTLKSIQNSLEGIRENKKLIHCLTNVITVNDLANSILALGAFPIMAHHKEEVADIASRSDALVLNLGATEYLDEIFEVAILPEPIKIIDPVGVGASRFRRDAAQKLIEISKPSAICGNYSEILALIENRQTARGVDSENDFSTKKDKLIKTYAAFKNTIVIATGKEDIVSDGVNSYLIQNGSTIMSKVAGTGCMMTGILASFLSYENNIESAVKALLYMSLCAEKAEKLMLKNNTGTASFKQYLIDNLFLFPENFNEEIKYKRI